MGDVARGPSIAFGGRQTGQARGRSGRPSPAVRATRGLARGRARAIALVAAGRAGDRASAPGSGCPRRRRGGASSRRWRRWHCSARSLRARRTHRAGGALFALACLLGCTLIWVRADRAGGATLVRPRVARFAATIVRVEPLPARDATRLLLRPAGTARLPALVRLTVPTGGCPGRPNARRDDRAAARAAGAAACRRGAGRL